MATNNKADLVLPKNDRRVDPGDQRGSVKTQLNQDFMILNRNGQSIVSRISGVAPALVIQGPDVMLLSYFFENQKRPDVAAQFVNHPSIKKWLPHLQCPDVEKRIQQFRQAQLIGGSHRTGKPIKATKLVSEQVFAAVDLPVQLSLSSNAGISISEQGYFSISKIDKKPRLLPVSWVILMLAFGDGQNYDEVLKNMGFLFEEDVKMVLKTLFGHGFLIRQKAKSFNTEPEYASISKCHGAVGWQEIYADGRIPVYFVPHMENHLPLALGIIFSALKNHDKGALSERFQLIPITYLDPSDFLKGPYRKFGTGVWLFSNYMWSLDVNLQISEVVKRHDQHNLTIHGGPSTPQYQGASEAFMTAQASVDVCVHGEGEVAITEVFEHISKTAMGQIAIQPEQLAGVAGLTFRGKTAGEFIRTAARQRMTAPDDVPSPYLSGLFDTYNGRVDAIIIESNRGCPFGCTFCDWGSATNQKIRKFDLDRVKKEIEWAAKNRVRVIWIADANFGLYDRDIELSRFIIETKEEFGYPKEIVVNYTKNSTWRLVEIIKIFTAGGIISQGIISIQTTDEKTLEVINRKNIKTEKYDELTRVFHDLELPLSTDLMIGLPGITVEAFSNDIQRYIDMDVSVKAYPTQLLPNSPMADPEYIEKYQIKVDENDFLISSFSFTERDLNWMKCMAQTYAMADGYCLLRNVMRYLQWEHDIRAMDFLQDLLRFVRDKPNQYQQISWAVLFFEQNKYMPGGWNLFYQQVAAYIKLQYGIDNNSSLRTVLSVNEACMPDDTLNYPLQVDLKHDFTAYFLARTSQSEQREMPLADFPPAKFSVSDPNSMVSIDLDYLQYDNHQYFWELHSEVSRAKSISEFA